MREMVLEPGRCPELMLRHLQLLKTAFQGCNTYKTHSALLLFTCFPVKMKAILNIKEMDKTRLLI